MSASTSNPQAAFAMGRVLATPNALDCLTSLDIHSALRRHQAGDWGELESEDRQANELALKEGSRLLSAYRSLAGDRFWIITEADRSATTVLLPEDY